MDKLALFGGPPMRATLLPYAHQTIEPDDLAAVTQALASDWITQGPTIARFERALAERAGVKHAVAVANGTAALHAACWAAGLGPGDEAITTPLTFAATANAVVYQGARPVFADIDRTTLNLDPDAVKRVATERTRAILPVDFAGLPCEYDRLLPLAREHGWLVIADAAHSFGGACDGRPVGALADMTTLSFHPAKLITTGRAARCSRTAMTSTSDFALCATTGSATPTRRAPGATRSPSPGTTTGSPTSSRRSGSRSSPSSTGSGRGAISSPAAIATVLEARPSSSFRPFRTDGGTAGTSSS